MATNTISLRPASIIGALSVMAVLLILASVVSQLALHASNHPGFVALSKLVFVDAERNVPSAFSSLLLLFAALLLALAALLTHKRSEPDVAHWTILSLGFVAMAVDEAMSYHEQLVGPMRSLLGNEDLGVFYFSWVLPGILLVLVIGVFFARFLWRLPRCTAAVFVLAATLYLGGAIGVEMLGGRYAEQNGMLSLTYSMIATLEESLEMAGVIVFIWALLRYLGENYGEVRLRIEGASRLAGASGATRSPGASKVAVELKHPARL